MRTDSVEEYYIKTSILKYMARNCFALDLKNDPEIISEYEKYHEAVWPDILQSLRFRHTGNGNIQSTQQAFYGC